MAGVERIVITDKAKGPGHKRFEWSRARHLDAANLYHDIFNQLGTPLEPGYEEIKCTQAEFDAGYDRALGIDVFLNFGTGMTATLQEKFLSTTFRTVTIEYLQNWRTGEQGDWFNLKAQYYFVGYDRREAIYKLIRDRGLTLQDIAQRYYLPMSIIQAAIDGTEVFQDWMLLDWPSIMRETAQGNIQWRDNHNKRDGARASFRYVAFKAVPSGCVVASTVFDGRNEEEEQLELALA
jgi:hypothetical protein